MKIIYPTTPEMVPPLLPGGSGIFLKKSGNSDAGNEVRNGVSSKASELREPLQIILADDDPDDRELFEEAIIESKLKVDVKCVHDGLELISLLKSKLNPLPHLIFLDLNMPNKNGKECLEEIRKNEKLRNIPVIIYSTSSSPKDIEETYSKGANLYVAKPSSFSNLSSIIKQLLTMDWNRMKPHGLKSAFVFQPSRK